MECISQESTSHSGNERSRDDLFAKALKKKEHPGRVKGVSFGVSQREYFTDPKPSKDMEMESLRSMVKGRTKSLSSLQREVDKIRASRSRQPHEDEVISLKDSCPEPIKMLPEVKALCQLEFSLPSYRMVAKGHMFNRQYDRTLHNHPLPTNLVKVCIDTEVEKDAPLPVPLDDEVLTISDALGTCVAWPMSLVIVIDASSFGPSKSFGNQKSGTSKHLVVKPRPPVGKPARESDRCEDLELAGLPRDFLILGKYMKMMSIDDQITIDFEERIMNIEFQEFIGREEICHLLCQEEIGASLISVYIKYSAN